MSKLKYDATWTLEFKASFSDDKAALYRNRLASLLKKRGFEKTGEMTWKKKNASSTDAASMMERIFTAHQPGKRLVVRLRQLSLVAFPNYGRTLERTCRTLSSAIG